MNKKLNDISQKLTGNNGNKYFLKNFNYKLTGKNGYFDKKITPNLLYHKHIIPDELVNYPITPKCNILIPLVVDTEFTAYNGKINKLSIEQLRTFEKDKEKLNEDKKYYDFSSILLKDGGIKSRIIKQYLPYRSN